MVFVITTAFAVETAPPNVAPPEFVNVNVPISVPIAPVTLTVPVVLSTTSDAAPPAVPVIEAIVIEPELPLPTRSVTPSPKMTLLSTTADEPKSKVLVELKNVVLPPKLKVQVEADEHCEGFAAVNVPSRILSPVLWVIPRVKVSVSLVASP